MCVVPEFSGACEVACMFDMSYRLASVWRQTHTHARARTRYRAERRTDTSDTQSVRPSRLHGASATITPPRCLFTPRRRRRRRPLVIESRRRRALAASRAAGARDVTAAAAAATAAAAD